MQSYKCNLKSHTVKERWQPHETILSTTYEIFRQKSIYEEQKQQYSWIYIFGTNNYKSAFSK